MLGVHVNIPRFFQPSCELCARNELITATCQTIILFRGSSTRSEVDALGCAHRWQQLDAFGKYEKGVLLVESDAGTELRAGTGVCLGPTRAAQARCVNL